MMDCGSSSNYVEEEYEKLVIGMNPPRVSVDNDSNEKTTLIKVDSANKRGSLLQVVQVLIDLNLTIKRAYISSDGNWFMDVFYVVDEKGRKVYDSEVVERIQQSLSSREFSCLSQRHYYSVELIQASTKHTSIELVGRDRPGLLSEIFAVLTKLKCNIKASQVWTHNTIMASVINITDQATQKPIEDQDLLAKIKNILPHVLKGNKEESSKTEISMRTIHMERRLHQMMYEDRDYDKNDLRMEKLEKNGKIKIVVSVEDCAERGYTVLCVRSKDRPKLLFDTVCTLTDMQYLIFHATVTSQEPEAYQEFFIRHVDGRPVQTEGEKQRLVDCLEAAIERRSTEGLRLELRSKDRIGLLSYLTQTLREHGLSIIRAEISTREDQILSIFYVSNASGNTFVQNQTIESLKNQMGETLLSLKDNQFSKPTGEDNGRFSFGRLFKFMFNKLFVGLVLIITCSY